MNRVLLSFTCKYKDKKKKREKYLKKMSNLLSSLVEKCVSLRAIKF